MPLLDAQSWTTYLTAQRDGLVDSFERAKAAYLALRKVRGDLGLPVEDDALDQPIADTNAMTILLKEVADDAIVGKRKVSWSLDVERLPVDTVHIVGTTMYSNVDDKPMPATGRVGFVEFTEKLPTSVANMSSYLAVTKLNVDLENIAEQKTLTTIDEVQRSGKATPEQALALSQALRAAAQRSGVELVKPSPKPEASLGEKVLLASVVIGTVGLLLRVWSEYRRPGSIAAGG